VIDTAVIPAAGLGGRLIPVTKEIPKIMLPVFQKETGENIFIKPLLEIIFENLYRVGIRNFCIIVGRGKETIENHLTPHYEFLDYLIKNGNKKYAETLTKLYQKIENSSIIWKRQHTQLGIGHTVLLAKEVVRDNPFIFHLGDLYIPSSNYYKKLIEVYEKFKCPAVVGLKKVNDTRQYGAAYGEKISKGAYRLSKLMEKPKSSTSNMALSGVNIFQDEVFDAARKTDVGNRGEIELTDCIQTMIKEKKTVIGYEFNSNQVCIDIGTPSNYFKSLSYSFHHVNARYDFNR
jgi:UTP--glucose-1-phosphate uridylyltransferase